MAKSSVSDMTTKRSKEPFDPALDAPVALTPDQLEKALTPDQLEKVTGGIGSGLVGPHTTAGYVPPR